MHIYKDLTIIILTYNEERNISDCLNSVLQLPCTIYIVDSGSTDTTLDIINQYSNTTDKIKVVYNQFISYSEQRNWAQKNNPFKTKWVFHLDAGERITEDLSIWIKNNFDVNSPYNGFMFSRQTYFLNRWIKYGGHYPNYHLRLYKTEYGKCEDKAYDQHFVVQGDVKKIPKADIIDIVADDLISFTYAHTRWAVVEAKEILTEQKKGEVQENIVGNPIEKKRWLKNNLFQKSPIFVRSISYYLYRYFIKLGFLDGKEGLVFHFLQGFWFRFLVDSIVYEVRISKPENETIDSFLAKKYQIKK